MDETITTTKQDALPAKGQPSSGDNGGTSKESAETLTKDQVDKLVSDALAKAGRTAKDFEKKEAAIKTEKEAIAKWQADREKEELDSVKDDPEALTLLQRKKAVKEAEAKLATEREALDKEKAEHAEKLTAAEETERELLIWELAGDKIDPDKLKGICDKLKAKTKEEIQAIVDIIAGEVKPNLKIKPDLSATIGSGTKSDDQRLKERYPTMK